MKLKSETMPTFVNFSAFVDRQISHKIITLHTDWGGEYRSLIPFLDQQGVTHIHSYPYIYQQNDLAEKHQHIVALLPNTY